MKEISYWMPLGWKIVDYSLSFRGDPPFNGTSVFDCFYFEFYFTILSPSTLFDQTKLQSLIDDIELYTGFFIKEINVNIGNYSISECSLPKYWQLFYQ